MERYKLSDLLTIKNGKDYKDIPEGNYPVFGSGGLMCKISQYLYNKPSILLPRKGTLSNIQYYESPFWTVDTLYYTIVNDKIVNPYYLYCYLRNLDLSGLDSGASIPSMTFKSYYCINVLLPQKKVQNKIASILSTYDNLIEKNNRKIAILQQMAEELYKEWFVRFRFPGHKTAKFKDGIPENWETKPLREWLVDDFNGGWGNDVSTQKTPYEAFVIRGTDIEDIKNAIIDDVPRRYHKPSDMNTKMLKEYDIVLELSNGNINNIGRTLFIDKHILSWFDKVMCASFCKTLRFKDKKTAFLVWQYINYLQNSGLMLYYKNTGANGINNFNFKRFLEMKISIPRNLNCIDDLMRYYDTISLLNGANYILRKQRDLLLPRLMSGKLKVKA